MINFNSTEKKKGNFPIDSSVSFTGYVRIHCDKDRYGSSSLSKQK